MNTVWPKEIEEGLILTDNAMGVMTRELSPAAEAFVALARTSGKPLLEIGAAYGNATLPALRAGATVIANDLSSSELQVLAMASPAEDQRRLVLLPAKFPDDVHFADASLSGILAAQVFHFFDGPTVDRAFQKAYRFLEPGGSLFVLVMTPSLSYYRGFRERFEERLKNGERWPGIFDPKEVATPDWRDHLPPFVNLFEKSLLQRCAEESGFLIDHLEHFCFKDFPDKHRTDGREYVSLAAHKPASPPPE